jgi:two-component system phosphate regulon sensor histidine kinase PhoR
MGKRLFVLLVVLMSLSLIGIIFVQSYFINNSLQNEDRQFTLSVKRALSFVSRSIEEIEYRNYVTRIQPYLITEEAADSINLQQLYITIEDEDNDQTIVHRNTVIEERFKVPSLFFEIDADSISVSKLSNERVTNVYSNNRDNGTELIPLRSLREYSDMEEEEKILYKTSFRDLLKDFPVYKRISPNQVKYLLQNELFNEGIEIDFEFAIYDDDLATKVQSDNYQVEEVLAYGVPIFLDNNNESSYKLLVKFPERRKFLLSTIMWMILLSVIFTSIIILAYSSAIYQLIKQRQISQIKSDFINNMTHEFKTPIATINLALDSIKNPKIIDDKEKVQRYMKMIREENKRMHAQVENVLRISKLEKNELNISKERLKLHDLIEDAVTHVELIVENRNGYIKLHLNAAKSSILANESHFTNVIVNILDNAIKYSDDEPKIDIYTENIGNNILMRIADQGNGMSKQVQKRVFENFTGSTQVMCTTLKVTDWDWRM